MTIQNAFWRNVDFQYTRVFGMLKNLFFGLTPNPWVYKYKFSF